MVMVVVRLVGITIALEDDSQSSQFRCVAGKKCGEMKKAALAF
jgi:hypothetical protein